VPSFFIESFRIPPFLLPIYEAAGTAYGIPWQVLAAINEVETDYGRDLSVSSAGAEGWMQFLPSSWAQYGVDANGDGFKDPYNPADAIFAAARYLAAAGGATNVKAAVFSYNHSQAYVATVMLRAQLLGGSPPALLGAITGLTEARFPVHAAAHFSDTFPTVPASAAGPAKTLTGTTIYAQAGSSVIAVQDGEITRIGHSPSLGRFVSMRDAYGNTYVYAQLGKVASMYPVIVPHDHAKIGAGATQPTGGGELPPSGPATAGAQPRSPVSEAASESGLALGAAAPLESSPAFGALEPVAPVKPAPPPPPRVKVFREGPNDVYLHPLRVGAQVIAGTVLGHVGADANESVSDSASAPSAQGSGSHMLFQIRPAGVEAPLIDPKPILDGWVALENTSIFRAKGENPFLATSPTVGQVLLESKQQLEPEVLRDSGIHLGRCARQDIQAGGVGKHVLATLEFLSVSGLKPTVSGLRCTGATLTAAEAAGNVGASSGGDAVNVTAINGVPIAGHGGPRSITDIAVRRLLKLQGLARPVQIVSSMRFPGTTNTVVKPGARDIHLSFGSPNDVAHSAGVFDTTLTANQWSKLVARLGEIPDPTVATGPSSAAIPDKPGAQGATGTEADGNN
jgi:murein DD-endopeptidase MepM/ murein hydrolase activator NlpD